MLSDKDKKFLAYVDNYIIQHGYSPSYREIGDALGYNSVSYVSEKIKNLITDGFLESDEDNKARAIRSPRIKMWIA